MGTLVPAQGGISKDRVLEVNDFVNPQVAIAVTLNNLTISEDAPRTPAPDNYNTAGGGIRYDGFDSATSKNSGVLTLNNVKVTGNKAAGQGGGILPSFGSCVIQSNANGQSIVSNNTSTFAPVGAFSIRAGTRSTRLARKA